MTVHDKDWHRAVAIGEQIERDFPDWRGTREIIGMIKMLRQQAAKQTPPAPEASAALPQESALETKQRLQREFMAAHERGDIDKAMALLNALDHV